MSDPAGLTLAPPVTGQTHHRDCRCDSLRSRVGFGDVGAPAEAAERADAPRREHAAPTLEIGDAHQAADDAGDEGKEEGNGGGVVACRVQSNFA